MKLKSLLALSSSARPSGTPMFPRPPKNSSPLQTFRERPSFRSARAREADSRATFPLDPKLPALLSELFGSNAGENLRLNPPLFGAASVVTHDVPDYAVAVGNPARVVKFLEKEKFKD